jgi:hypothetical protein
MKALGLPMRFQSASDRYEGTERQQQSEQGDQSGRAVGADE